MVHHKCDIPKEKKLSFNSLHLHSSLSSKIKVIQFDTMGQLHWHLNAKVKSKCSNLQS